MIVAFPGHSHLISSLYMSFDKIPTTAVFVCADALRPNVIEYDQEVSQSQCAGPPTAP